MVTIVGSMPRLDLNNLPDDPLERLEYLLDVEAEVAEQIDEAYAVAYFDARFLDQLVSAIELRRHGRRRILAMIRRVNYRMGSAVRWSDGMDTHPPASSSSTQPRE